MNIMEIAREVDNLFYEDKFKIEITSVGGVAKIKLTNYKNQIIEFSKIGELFCVDVYGSSQHITDRDFGNILSPYLGRRMLLNI